jgi:hypothetical protein
MKMNDFLMLNSHKQALTLLTSGKMIRELTNSSNNLQLYSISNFFVELELEPFTNKVINRKLFASGKELVKYYSDIDNELSLSSN